MQRCKKLMQFHHHGWRNTIESDIHRCLWRAKLLDRARGGRINLGIPEIAKTHPNKSRTLAPCQQRKAGVTMAR